MLLGSRPHFTLGSYVLLIAPLLCSLACSDGSFSGGTKIKHYTGTNSVAYEGAANGEDPSDLAEVNGQGDSAKANPNDIIEVANAGKPLSKQNALNSPCGSQSTSPGPSNTSSQTDANRAAADATGDRTSTSATTDKNSSTACAYSESGTANAASGAAQ